MKIREIAFAIALSASYATFGEPREASVPSSDSAPNDEKVQLALQAVRMSYPAKAARQEAVMEFEKQFRISFGQNPKGMELEKLYPGITDAMVDSGSTEMAALVSEIEPKILLAVAEDLARQASAEEIKIMIDFYRSTAGQALISLDPKLMDKKTGLMPISSLSLENRKAIGRFQSSRANQHIMGLSQNALAAITAKAANIMAPFMPRINAKIEAAARAFVAKGGKQ